MAASIIVVTCHNPSCQKKFNKRIAEFKRSERLGRLHFCSKSCFGKFKGLTNFGDKANKDTSYLRNIIRRDEYSPFRNHLKVMKKSAKHRKHECSVTLADLKQLWEKQQGICPYTGWNLVLLPSTTDYQNTILTIDRASVDRIDSSLGYIPENIQFVAVIANFAKNIFTEKDLIKFCHDVYKYKILGNNSIDDCKFLKLSTNILTNHLINSRRDEYSPFRQHHRLARRRVKSNGRECNITLEYLKLLWEKQGGRCPYTGWNLDNHQTTSEWDSNVLHPKTASLDRIDSRNGYILGNVQFVSVMANYAKRDFLEQELLEFCQAVADVNSIY
ncbi:hypothetical protein IQ247_01690 [Plectonema cf. radiosum LEGE 06105]|uniref:Uncharacterized protein n=1 Tax=Plectonema cf. radiosum LEGE 06105 TaxID=945769 RepID=A0A8J7EZB3_9CYAN|nr:hypothetical protein [Plectonema radiosum]MBE9211440.1 hypothetical protein [Plectonema cf. radiosum LEGE 06105]